MLLVAGRRLYWLALGATGFVFGWLVGEQLLPPADHALRLGLAAVLGVAGLVLAIVAQKLAITLGGLAAGGLGALWLSQPWHPELGGWVWLLALAGALIGIGLATAIFDLTLVLVSSWIGATLTVDALGLRLDELARVALFAALFAVGLAVQIRSARRRRT
ncbi:MAG: hypothetical protein D6696_05905 [Acidobacteria bacterium]|nr:MAG: hypothetical protein D6696_05905 [Acidobacteriota bacterium]